MFREEKEERTRNLKLFEQRCIYFEVSLDISAPRWWNEQSVCVCVYFGYFPLRRVNGARLVKSDGWCKIQRIWNSAPDRLGNVRRDYVDLTQLFRATLPGQPSSDLVNEPPWIASTSWKLAIVASLLRPGNRGCNNSTLSSLLFTSSIVNHLCTLVTQWWTI